MLQKLLYVLQSTRFGRWTVVGRAPQSKHRQPMYYCVCDCGTERIVLGYALKTGHSKSCGCLHRELFKKQITKHGLSKNKFNKAYRAIQQRCNNKKEKNYFRYGGRGIKNLFSSFDEFKKTMYKSYLEHIKKYGSKNTVIDRINNNGSYSPSNCRWVTWKESANNTRLTNLI